MVVSNFHKLLKNTGSYFDIYYIFIVIQAKKGYLSFIVLNLQPLANLKKMDLNFSYRLKEIPNLSKATNLETLLLSSCSSLVELPSSIKNLHKLKKLKMKSCKKLRLIPTNINLISLKGVDMDYCSQLETFPDISRNIKTLSARDTKIKDVPASVVGRWSRCRKLEISLERLTHVPQGVTKLDLINSAIKRIPECITGLSHLVDLIVENCTNLGSIPALPPSLKSLNANSCVSLKTVDCSFHNPVNVLTFYNCVELDEDARRGIIQQSVQEYLCLPGKEVPAEFTYKATGKSITIPLAPGGEGAFSASSRFKACFLLSPIKNHRFLSISCRLRGKGGVEINSFSSGARLGDLSPLSEHLFIFHGDLFDRPNRHHEVEVAASEISFEFSCRSNDDKIIECGVQILTEEAEGSSSERELENFETETNITDGGYGSDDGGYELVSMLLSVCKGTKMQKAEGILALCKYVKMQDGDEGSSSSSEVENFEEEKEMINSIFEYLKKKEVENIQNEGNSFDASDELVLSLTFSVCQYIEKKEAEGSSEVNSSNASKELVLAMLYLVGKYIEKKEAEGSSSEVNNGHESNEIVLKRIVFSLLIYIKVKEVDGSSSINRGDASKELVLPVFLYLCEYIKKKEAEGNSSNNQVNNGDASNELLLAMILSASEKIETQEAEVILSQCEDIIKEDAEGSSSSNSEVNSDHASNKLVLSIILRVFQYIIKKEAEGTSSKREEENQSDGAFKVSIDENVVKTNKHTNWLSGLKKLVGLKKKKNKPEELLDP